MTKQNTKAELGDIIECTIKWPKVRRHRIHITSTEICKKANAFLCESPDIWKLIKTGEY